MMNNIKIAAAVLILSSGVVGSYFIVKNSVPKVDSAQKIAESPIQNIINDNPIKWFSKINSTSSANFNSPDSLSPDIFKNTGRENDQYNSNLTQLVSQSLFSKMKSQDQAGSNPFDNFNYQDSENKKLVESALLEFKNLINDISVNDSDLKISNDNSGNTKAQYLEATGKIILDNSNEFYDNPGAALNMIVENSDLSGLNQVIISYSNIYNAFLKTPVPSDWLSLHKNYLILLKQSEMAYSGIKDYKQDPIKAQLLIQAAQELSKKEAEIKKEYYQRVLEVNS